MNTATYTVSAHEGRHFVTDGDHTLGDFATYEEALERAEELESELDAESERFGDHGVGDCWDEGRGDYDGDHVTGLASVYGEDW
jgi:hypothetical protein